MGQWECFQNSEHEACKPIPCLDRSLEGKDGDRKRRERKGERRKEDRGSWQMNIAASNRASLVVCPCFFFFFFYINLTIFAFKTEMSEVSG